MKRYKINNMDVMDWAKKYKGPKFHALLTDAPYHLTMVKRMQNTSWDKEPATLNNDKLKSSAMARFFKSQSGFMGMSWDGGDISFRPEMWAALGEHLYPGAFGMTFGGSRTAHRIAVAIEDAGFIIHPMVFWLYGSGFPKATRVKGHKEFDGHRYGLQALKPAVEPIIVFQKLYDDKSVQNIVKYGAGALNIDAGRIPLADGDGYVINTFDDGAKPFGNGAGHQYTSKRIMKYKPKGIRPSSKERSNNYIGDDYKTYQSEVEISGRWPANFILDDSVSNVLDAQSGMSVSTGGGGKRPKGHDTRNGIFGIYGERNLPSNVGLGDAGGASRFFYNVQTQLDEADPFKYQKKSSTKERNAGLEEKNTHPTVKPIDLNRYLASLLLPPIDYAPRRILVPFSGVMSEGIGALLAGWEYVEAIELGKHYCELGEKRTKYWLK